MSKRILPESLIQSSYCREMDAVVPSEDLRKKTLDAMAAASSASSGKKHGLSVLSWSQNRRLAAAAAVIIAIATGLLLHSLRLSPPRVKTERTEEYTLPSGSALEESDAGESTLLSEAKLEESDAEECALLPETGLEAEDQAAAYEKADLADQAVYDETALKKRAAYPESSESASEESLLKVEASPVYGGARLESNFLPAAGELIQELNNTGIRASRIFEFDVQPGGGMMAEPSLLRAFQAALQRCQEESAAPAETASPSAQALNAKMAAQPHLGTGRMEKTTLRVTSAHISGGTLNFTAELPKEKIQLPLSVKLP